MAANDVEAQILDQWSHRLAQALQLLDLDFDRELILDLAGESARSVTHAAAPITALMVGYAAGLAAGTRSAGTTSNAAGGAAPKEASAASVAQAAAVAFRLCEDGADGGPSSKGWADTAQ
ncbi:molybdopterin-guanine dinucleotide biosynthesis protein [Arthrobacter sp. SPG23]|uniref:DUF6457 domain-containing protein n=1 Tax=Arthrobacter sp. SPG23 TaxID=1610703 RepID=UPI0005BC3AAE|nr:DUF6457 domain-containing protein [Arthrobacter sp. SPG23]KIS28618.1 molybdopterin-guanine dinucleotide biosynthesis protein [Arthrobacter sp. SPG23]